MPLSVAPKKRHPRPGRPKDPAKREAIFEAAKKLFPEHGYDGVSMDAIAAEAGVSKLTLYSHFKDKEELFLVAIEAICKQQLSPEVFELGSDRSCIREVLVRAGWKFVELVGRDAAIWVYRTLTKRAPGDSHLSDIFFEVGPRLTIKPLENFLREADKSGMLDVPDPAQSAEHLSCLFKGVWHTRRIIGCSGQLSPEEMDAHLRSVVDLFVRAHEPRNPSAGQSSQ
jgi:TetR/AcrR family transcriptional repressor of mexJK operon